MSDLLDERVGQRRAASPKAILWAVGFSVFVAADDLTVVSTMLRPMILDVGLQLPDGLDDAAWIVNAYLIAFIAVMPIAGRVSDVIGRRRTFLIAYGVFLLGTIWIPLADSLGPLLVGRVLTAIGGGAMVPVALAVVGDVYPIAKRARALGTLGAIETLGWVWGPLYGAMLVRFLSWRWQFWLNVPLAIVGAAAVWWALAEHDRPERRTRVDWVGASLLTAALVSLNLALLGSAEVQSVQGLDQLTGNGGTDLRWLYPVAVLAIGMFVLQQRRLRAADDDSAADPIIDTALFRGRNVRVALIVNFVVGAGLVIAMVDVPLFVNAVEIDLERSAVIAGWILSSLTAAMAVASYVGGRVTERTWYGPPILLGLVAATVAYSLMGATWSGDTPYPLLAAQLALLGAGIGLTVAPTTSAVVDHAAPDSRGAAAAAVMVVRMIGLSVGLSALTAWGLSRFNALRSDIDLPPITDPGFQEALTDVTADLTARSIADTFLASALAIGVGLVLSLALLRRQHAVGTTDGISSRLDDIEGTPPMPTEPDDTSPHSSEPVTDSATVAEPATTGGWIERRLGVVIGVMGGLVLASLLLSLVMFARMQSTENDLDATRADLERVEAGAAIYASQVTGFAETIGELGPGIDGGLDQAITQLEEFGTSVIEFEVAIDQTISIDENFAIQRTIEVPINTSIPIKEEIQTTITIDGPFGVAIPLDITVPVDLDVPIDLTVDIPIDEEIPVNVDIPVTLDVPIEIAVEGTELQALTQSLIDGLRSFQDGLSGLTDG